MNNEEKQIAIAEARGWHISHDGPGGDWQGLHPRLHQADDTPVGLPDYLNDRDAMIEAIKTLTPEQQRTVAELLCGDLVDVMLASAEDLADAFLKTIGKLP